MKHDDIRLVEQLAALELNDSERQQLGVELDNMLEYLNVMDSYSVEKSSQSDMQTRPLAIDGSPYRVFQDTESYLQRAPERYRNWILIPNVL